MYSCALGESLKCLTRWTLGLKNSTCIVQAVSMGKGPYLSRLQIQKPLPKIQAGSVSIQVDSWEITLSFQI